jgi:hypothetical protein
MNITIEAVPGNSFNSGEIKNLLPSSKAAMKSGSYIFPASMAGDTNGAAIKVQVSSNRITISGGSDSQVRSDFRPIFEGLLQLNNFGKVTPPNAEKLLR